MEKMSSFFTQVLYLPEIIKDKYCVNYLSFMAIFHNFVLVLHKYFLFPFCC